MSKMLVRYTDFTKGDGGWIDKAKLAPGFFVGEQVMLYRDGSLGPRSGVVDLGATGPPAGTFFNMGYIDMANDGTEYVWIWKGTNLARVAVYNSAGKVLTGQAFANAAGVFAATPFAGYCDWCEYDPQFTYFTSLGDKSYRCDWGAGANGTLSALAGSPGGECCEVFNEFLVVANVAGAPNRIRFSAPGNTNSWPASNFFDVGAHGTGAPAIQAIRRLRDQLLVWTREGQLFIVTGRLGASQVVREFMPGDQMSGPYNQNAVVRSRDGTVWWTRREELPNTTDEPYDRPSAVPVAFTGGQRTERLDLGGYLRQPNFSSSRLSRTVGVSGRSEKSVVLSESQSGRALVNRQDAWTRHKLAPLSPYRLTNGSRGDCYAMDSAAAHLRAWLFEIERPPWAFSGSNAEQLPYADLDAGGAYSPVPWFATPEFRTPDFENINVDHVEVMFTSHATRSGLTNHMEIFVQQYDSANAVEKIDPASFFPPDSTVSGGGQLAALGVTVGGTVAFDQATPATDQRRRMTFHPIDRDSILPSPGVRILVRALRGVSVREITVYGELTPAVRP